VLAAALPPGSVAYIDRDWLASSSTAVPSLVAAPDGTLAWCDDRPVPTPSSVDSDTAAALALLAVAEAAVAAAEGIACEMIEVTGRGAIALQVRALLDRPPAVVGGSASFEPPAAIVDTTGDPGVIFDATRRIADLGRIVLVGEGLGRPAEMDLYPDVHVRGLSLVGVSGPLQHANSLFSETSADDPLVASCRAALVDATAGAPVAPGAAWYRVAG